MPILELTTLESPTSTTQPAVSPSNSNEDGSSTRYRHNPYSFQFSRTAEKETPPSAPTCIQ